MIPDTNLAILTNQKSEIKIVNTENLEETTKLTIELNASIAANN